MKVAKTGQTFISDGSTVLVHSSSRVVFYTLLEALKAKKRLTVFVTESSPSKTGHQMKKWLEEEGMKSVSVIPDSAIGFFLERVDLVLVGAEAVVKNGGIINRIGSYPLAVCAKAVNKPFYVLVESYKFSQLYPLKQEDIPSRLKSRGDDEGSDVYSSSLSGVDYTPPNFVTLLVTDLGPLATAAVSDVLMQLYV